MKLRTIRQVVVIPATPEQVYDALTTTKGHVAFTGAPARIRPQVGATFSAWGGYIHGVNRELVRPRKIVQSWTPSEDTWPPDHESRVTYRLTKVRGGTRISFTHSGVPAEHVGHLSKGWHESYWRPLRKHFRAAK